MNYVKSTGISIKFACSVNVGTPVYAIASLLQINQAVMTADGSKVIGIVTNADLLARA